MREWSPRRGMVGRRRLAPGFLATVTLLFAPPTSAQGTRVLHGRVVALNGASLESIRLRAMNDLEVSRSGEFTTEVPAGAQSFSVSVVPPAGRDSEKAAWTIVYPLAGRVSVPVGDDPIVIVVGEPPEVTVMKALADRDRQSQQILREYGVQHEQLGTLEEGILQILAQLHIKEADLRDQVVRKQRQSDAYPPIAAAVNRYVLKARDLSTALELLGPLIKTSSRQQAFETLKVATEEYNDAYQALHTHADGFASDIEQAWDDGRLDRLDFDNFFRNTVEQTHATQFLPLNDVLLKVQTRLGRKDGELRAALDELSRRVQGLGPAVDALREAAARALERLRPEGV